MPRSATVHRKTGETDVRLTVELDGTGTTDIQTGVGFFDHMLTLLGRHAMLDLTVSAEGDLHVDAHHTVEDVGLALGQALREAVGDKKGIARYGDVRLPMDEVLAAVAIDWSGRPIYRGDLGLPAGAVLGTFAVELVDEFLRAVASEAKMALHVDIVAGGNLHHVAEACFKGLGRALRQACEPDPRQTGVPSTKGTL